MTQPYSLLQDLARLLNVDASSSQGLMDAIVATRPILETLRVRDPLPERNDPGSPSALEAWMKEHAPESHYNMLVTIKTGLEQGSGLLARTAIPVDKTVLSVSHSIMMTQDTARTHPRMRQDVSDPLFDKEPSVLLAVQLILEFRDPNSFWKPYLDLLPRTVSLPFTYTKEALRVLEGSLVLEKVLLHTRNVLRRFVHLTARWSALVDADPITFAEFEWATSIVMSRQNQIQPDRSNPQNTLLALIPVWDFCNHASAAARTYYNYDTSAIELTTSVAVAAGDQVFMHYGDRSVDDFFLYSGFVPSDAVQHFPLSLSLQPEAADPLHKIRRLFLEKRGLRPQGEVFQLQADGQLFSDDCLFYLRVMHMDKQDALAYMKQPESVMEHIEVGIMESLQQLLREMMARFPTSLEHDEAWQQDQSRDCVVATQYRCSEKRFLQKLLQRVQRLAAAGIPQQV